MGKPHKHAELIKMWAEGAEIEVLYGDGWVLADNPQWNSGAHYRVKLKPKYPETTLSHPQQMVVIADTPGGYYESYEALCNAAIEEFITSGEMDKYIKENNNVV